MLGGIALAAALFAAYRSGRAAWADVLARRGDVAQAVRIAPGNASYWVEMSNQKDFQDPAAEGALARARELNPHNADIWMQSGLWAEARGQLARAEAFLLRSELVSRQCGPQLALANFYFRTDNQPRFWLRVKRALACTAQDRKPLLDLCWSLKADAGFILREAIPGAPAPRRDFLQYLLSHNLLDAAETARRAVAADAGADDRDVLLRYTDRMADDGRWNAALAGWNALCERKLLPYEALDSERGPWLTNGAFGSRPLNAGFDWHVRPIEGVSASWKPASDGLRIQFSGAQPEECEVLRQFVPVQPLRSYTLQCAYSLSGIAPGSGLILRLTDAGRGTEIAAMGLDGGATQLSFNVPGGVVAMRLSLWYRRKPGATRIEGSIALNGVRLDSKQ